MVRTRSAVYNRSMTLIAANTTSLVGAAGTLRSTGVGHHLAGMTSPSFGDPTTDGAASTFGQAWGTRMQHLDGLVEAAGALVALYAANFNRVGG
ncbi:MAG: hypothetical protein M3Y91_12955 [Actinomycetota bacterium]|nr:hypothetical protein [Actinomycetota bacterium]